jgi:hypothetical protein
VSSSLVLLSYSLGGNISASASHFRAKCAFTICPFLSSLSPNMCGKFFVCSDDCSNRFYSTIKDFPGNEFPSRFSDEALN